MSLKVEARWWQRQSSFLGDKPATLATGFALLIALCSPLSAQTPSPTFNPDPGASYKAKESPLFPTPPGTPPDYGEERDPLLDLPSAPPVDLRYIRKYWQNQDYMRKVPLPAYSEGVPDRWEIPIPVWMRYNNPDRETPYMYQTPRYFDPYKQSVLKGDVPIFGQNYFLSLSATSFTSYEARNVPTPSGVSSARANSTEFFGEGNQEEVDQFFLLNFDFFEGETNFQPVTWLAHFQPVYNINYSAVKETGVLNPNPQGANPPSGLNSAGYLYNGSIVNPGDSQSFLKSGTAGSLQNVGPQQLGTQYVTRTADFLSLQEAFLEFHLYDLTSNYDFISIRVGNQPFNSDFRGFVFNDTNLGVRIFGNADNNRWQYNLAVFDMREKDTYSDLNTFNARNQVVYVANVYRQDFLFKGYTAQLSFLANYDDGGTHYNRSGDLVRPEPLGSVSAHYLRAYYFGWNGDGHIGRLNFTHSFYEVVGYDQLNGLAGQREGINAQMGALEVSYDLDWLRFKGYFFYASGDHNPNGSHATGFDSIVDNANFIGGANSYYFRQGFLLGNTGVNFKNRASLLPDLRSSKFEGQSNFVNPGVFIYGLGVDADLLPNLKVSFNANYILLADVAPINQALERNNTTGEIGWDLNIGAKYRPLLTDNIIVTAGLGALLPGAGYRSIYETSTIQIPGYPNQSPGGSVDSFLYSGFISLTLTY